MDDGWIKLSRNILRWRWRGNPPTFRVFIELLLLAEWDGEDSGTVVASCAELAASTGLTPRQVRRALENLVRTGEIKRSSSGHRPVTVVVNYRSYQRSSRKNSLTSDDKEFNPCQKQAPVTVAVTKRSRSGHEAVNERSSLSLLQEKEEEEEKDITSTTTKAITESGAAEAGSLVVGGGGGDVDGWKNILLGAGVAEAVAGELAAAFPASRIRAALDYTAAQEASGVVIRNRGAFLAAAVRDGKAPAAGPARKPELRKRWVPRKDCQLCHGTGYTAGNQLCGCAETVYEAV